MSTDLYNNKETIVEKKDNVFKTYVNEDYNSFDITIPFSETISADELLEKCEKTLKKFFKRNKKNEIKELQETILELRKILKVYDDSIAGALKEYSDRAKEIKSFKVCFCNPDVTYIKVSLTNELIKAHIDLLRRNVSQQDQIEYLEDEIDSLRNALLNKHQASEVLEM